MKGYIHIDDVYRLIAGHSNYHGDNILSALTCIAEGKNVTKPIIPLEQNPYEDCISRQAVLNTLDKMDKALDTDRTVENYKELLTECYKDLPPVKPKEETAH